MNKIAGVYRITNKVDDKIYIGSSVNINQRFFQHKSSLKHNNHDNSYLQNAYNKYGAENFSFEIIDVIILEISKILEREQYYMDFYQSFNREFGYNLDRVASGVRKVSKETIDKIIKTKSHKVYKPPMLGKKHSIETRLKMSNSAKIKIFTKEHCMNISRNNKGKIISLECRKKMSDAQKGKVFTQDHKDKISLAKKKFLYYFLSPNNEEVKISSIEKFCKNNGLDNRAMFRLQKKLPKYITHKGWKFIKRENINV